MTPFYIEDKDTGRILRIFAQDDKGFYGSIRARDITETSEVGKIMFITPEQLVRDYIARSYSKPKEDSFQLRGVSFLCLTDHLFSPLSFIVQ